MTAHAVLPPGNRDTPHEAEMSSTMRRPTPPSRRGSGGSNRGCSAPESVTDRQTAVWSSTDARTTTSPKPWRRALVTSSLIDEQGVVGLRQWRHDHRGTTAATRALAAPSASRGRARACRDRRARRAGSVHGHAPPVSWICRLGDAEHVDQSGDAQDAVHRVRQRDQSDTAAVIEVQAQDRPHPAGVDELDAGEIEAHAAGIVIEHRLDVVHQPVLVGEVELSLDHDPASPVRVRSDRPPRCHARATLLRRDDRRLARFPRAGLTPPACWSRWSAAEEAGFDAAMSSDHFAPWSTRQGQSGFAWAWLGAAMARTSMPFGVVNAPGQRYHPAIIAQAAATLAEMFPRRLWVALGTGEASNEHITGGGWPEKSVRTRRLGECVEVMRALFDGEEVTHHGLVTVDRARLWTRPADPPLLLGAAVSEPTAAWVGTWADGLATVGQPLDTLRRVLGAFREHGGDGKPAYLQVHVSWAPTDDEALALAHDQWRTNVFDPPLCWDLELVEHFDRRRQPSCGPRTSPSTCSSRADPARHLAQLAELVDVGFDGVWIHHVGQEQLAVHRRRSASTSCRPCGRTQ